MSYKVVNEVCPYMKVVFVNRMETCTYREDGVDPYHICEGLDNCPIWKRIKESKGDKGAK